MQVFFNLLNLCYFQIITLVIKTNPLNNCLFLITKTICIFAIKNIMETVNVKVGLTVGFYPTKIMKGLIRISIDRSDSLCGGFIYSDDVDYYAEHGQIREGSVTGFTNYTIGVDYVIEYPSGYLEILSPEDYLLKFKVSE